MFKAKILSEFIACLEKATNPMQREPDAASVNKICTMIDQVAIDAVDAIKAVNFKLLDENPDTVYFALKVLHDIFYKCGNIVHGVICSSEYMETLNFIVKETENKLIRDKVLELIEDWADKFRHLSCYKAPENLLRSLQTEGYVFPKFQDTDKPKMTNINNNKVDESLVVESTKTDECIKKELEEAREEQKRRYKKYCKENGIQTSSDEEDMLSPMKKSQEEQFFSSSKQLPTEMRKIKESRLNLKDGIKQFRETKNKEFHEAKKHNNDTDDKDLQKALKLSESENGCFDCNKYKKKPECEEVRITKQLPFELRQVKQSRAQLKNEFEEYKKEKKQDYYDKKYNLRSNINGRTQNYKNSLNMPRDDDIARAIELSKTEISRSGHLGDMQEDEDLKKALELSLLESGNNQMVDDDSDELQRAINLSFSETEDNHFSSMPKMEDDIALYFAAQLNLEETKKKETNAGFQDHDDLDSHIIDLCVICFEETIVKSFEPCKHRICDDCALSYTAQICPVCCKFYTAIR